MKLRETSEPEQSDIQLVLYFSGRSFRFSVMLSSCDRVSIVTSFMMEAPSGAFGSPPQNVLYCLFISMPADRCSRGSPKPKDCVGKKQGKRCAQPVARAPNLL